ncbi:UNKNOWN [Stylonychia lemnae]|uniref:Uncharacterized protein n=1 Tax=Stylonychia lemnae TaxID=5949 RepID=A0A078A1Y2_STYLE|nr:UNKNOWN [Stylonychia lemnae]|eukprot:CDW76140.1 UNKNOWN [Stylonychia lemnae]
MNDTQLVNLEQCLPQIQLKIDSKFINGDQNYQTQNVQRPPFPVTKGTLTGHHSKAQLFLEERNNSQVNVRALAKNDSKLAFQMMAKDELVKRKFLENQAKIVGLKGMNVAAQEIFPKITKKSTNSFIKNGCQLQKEIEVFKQKIANGNGVWNGSKNLKGIVTAKGIKAKNALTAQINLLSKIKA